MYFLQNKKRNTIFTFGETIGEINLDMDIDDIRINKEKPIPSYLIDEWNREKNICNYLTKNSSYFVNENIFPSDLQLYYANYNKKPSKTSLAITLGYTIYGNFKMYQTRINDNYFKICNILQKLIPYNYEEIKSHYKFLTVKKNATDIIGMMRLYGGSHNQLYKNITTKDLPFKTGTYYLNKAVNERSLNYSTYIYITDIDQFLVLKLKYGNDCIKYHLLPEEI